MELKICDVLCVVIKCLSIDFGHNRRVVTSIVDAKKLVSVGFPQKICELFLVR
jgi:hypothetical protein